jgi:hypothetical protein
VESARIERGGVYRKGAVVERKARRRFRVYTLPNPFK